MRMRSKSVVAGIVGGLLSLVAQPALAQETAFRFTSTPGSWVGHGYLNYSVSPATNWSFTATASPDHTYVRLSARSLDPNAPTSNYYWDLELESPNASPLAPGTYTGATRYPFNDPGEPGLTLSGNHRGNNENAGYFTIFQAEFGAGSIVNRFAVNFRQYDEGNPNNWVDGQFRFNATVPEPGTMAVVLISTATLARRRR